jgi:hypothetical protein
MSYDAQFADFQAVAIQAGHLQAAIYDAWQDFNSFDGPMIDFFKARKETHPHRYHSFVPAADSAEVAATTSLAGQAAHVKEFGADATRELLASFGMKLGQIRAPAKADPAKGENNPYSPEFKGTPEQREARIQSLIKSSATLAASLAKSCGCTITGQKIVAGKPFVDPRASRR